MTEVSRPGTARSEAAASTITVYHFTCSTGGDPAAAGRLATREAIAALPGATRILCTGVGVDPAAVENGFLRADHDWTSGGEPFSGAARPVASGPRGRSSG